MMERDKIKILINKYGMKKTCGAQGLCEQVWNKAQKELALSIINQINECNPDYFDIFDIEKLLKKYIYD